MTPHPSLDEASLAEATDYLHRRDRNLARIIDRLGPPPIWLREEGFPTLVHIILEQQVSLSSAKAAYERLIALASGLSPQRFLELDDTSLKAAGLSRQKIVYGRDLAQAIVDGRLDLAALRLQDDQSARAELLKIKGIGFWTADIYLLMALGRPDVWPRGDLALGIAVQQLRGLAGRPTEDELNAYSSIWRPWRAVAARVLWNHYLNPRSQLSLIRSYADNQRICCTKVVATSQRLM